MTFSLNQSNRAVGQYKRNLKDKDSYALLAVSVIDQAVRDVRALCGPNPRRKFQPGVQTRESELREERELLLKWLRGPEYEFWASAAGQPRDYFERRRDELLRALDGGAV